jgi:hypothetical protein
MLKAPGKLDVCRLPEIIIVSDGSSLSMEVAWYFQIIINENAGSG